MPQPSEYAKAGVDYRLLEPFKGRMLSVVYETAHFPERRRVRIERELFHAHGGVFGYLGDDQPLWCQTHEGLGNKNWIAEWMYENDGTGETNYDSIAVDLANMATNDNAAQGALPVTYTDEVAAGDSEWFDDERRARDLAEGLLRACRAAGMALVAGESPALRYLVNARQPVKSAPVLSGCCVGIISPRERLVDGRRLCAGDRIIGITSSGVHANGISLIIKKVMHRKEKFLKKLPSGESVGKAVLRPTHCYVPAVEELLESEVDVHAFLPGTGSGVAKLAFDKRPFTYRIHSWPEVPEIFHYLREDCGISLPECLSVFNWHIGYYVFVPPKHVDRALAAINVSREYRASEVGRVEEGERCTIFQPEGFKNPIVLPPPGA